MRNSPTPLSPREQAVLDRLEQWYDVEDTVTRAVAVEQLTAVGVDDLAARDCIEQLYLKGYLYEVDAGLRLTSRD